MPDADGDLVLAGLHRRFGAVVAVDGLDHTVPRGGFHALLGPSGCGKTTTLRTVAGLERPDAGTVRLGGVDLTPLPPHRRPVNTVFQGYALFPHLDVAGNVAFGLRRRGVREVDRRVREALELVDLPDLGRRRPHQLSGGQRQRVALARALVNRPRVLLLDEPLGALDEQLRRQVRGGLKRLQAALGTTFLHVTHDQEEALALADTVAVMHRGRIEQAGPPRELYDRPATRFVATFLGRSVLLPVRAVDRDGDHLVLEHRGHRLRLPAGRRPGAGDRLLLGVRPERVRLVEPGGGGPHPGGRLPGTVTEATFTGGTTEYRVSLDGGAEVAASVGSAAPPLAPGTRVEAVWDPGDCFALPDDAGRPAAVDLRDAGAAVPG